MTPENIDKVHDIILADRQVKVRDMKNIHKTKVMYIDFTKNEQFSLISS